MRSRILLPAAITVLAIVAIVGILYERRPTKEAAPAATAPGVSGPVANPPARPAVLLDGTYRFEYDYAKQTINGAPFAVRTNDNTAWWAFRSSCGSSGCVATATQLETNNPQVARNPAQPAEYRFADGHWQSAPAQRQLAQARCLGANGQVVAGANTVLLSWSFEPQPDGALRGMKTGIALTNDCGLQGQLAVAPVVATRVGDVPSGVAIADPATVTAAPAEQHRSSARCGSGPRRHLSRGLRSAESDDQRQIDRSKRRRVRVVGIPFGVHAGWMRSGRFPVGRKQPTGGNRHDKRSPLCRRSLAGHADPASSNAVRKNHQIRPRRRDSPVVIGSTSRRHAQGPRDRHHSQQWMRHSRNGLPNSVRRDTYGRRRAWRDRRRSRVVCEPGRAAPQRSALTATYRLARSSGTSTLCSRSTSRGTTSRVRS